MIRLRANENMLRLAVFVLLGLVLLLQIVARRGLFADGAYFLVYILDRHDFFAANESTRRLMYWFTQFPTVLAVRLGIRNLSFLTYLFSSWLLASPMLFWSLALWKLREDWLFWPFVAVFSVTYFNVNFFIIGEYNFSYALSAFSAAMLLRDQRATKSDRAALMLAAALLTMTYASTLFMGALLAALSWRHYRRETTPAIKRYWLLLAAVFLTASFVGLCAYLYPDLPSNKTSALDWRYLLDDAQLVLTGLCLGIMLLIFLINAPQIRYGLFITLLILEGINVLAIFHPWPVNAFSVRAFAGILLFGCLLVLTWLKLDLGFAAFKKKRFGNFPALYCVVPAFLLFAALAFYDMEDSLAYGRYVDDLGAYISKHSGYIEHGFVQHDIENDIIYGWCWTYPSISLLLRRSTEQAIALNADYCLSGELFNPFTELPDLSRYYAD